MAHDNTAKSFKDKWENNQSLALQETSREGSEIFRWILERNGFHSAEALRHFLSTKRRILDAGCGNGRVSALLRKYSDPADTAIVGIDLVAADIAAKNLSNAPNMQFLQMDLLSDLSALGTFDFIYCQEVLHHTDDPQGAFQNLTRHLAPGGELAIYVYKVKAPLREHADDFIRGKIADKPYDDAMHDCREIAALGKALSAANVRINVPQVRVLGIEAGEYDIQRFLYHFFLKCFWNNELSAEDNAAVNYDWYHPQTCSRHTIEEVRSWFVNAGLAITHEQVDFYGITVRGKRA
jgi:SAM-dependent methyltransferase